MSNNGIVQLSFPLNSEPMLGDYEILVELKSGAKTSYSFSVEEYGKPFCPCYVLVLSKYL